MKALYLKLLLVIIGISFIGYGWPGESEDAGESYFEEGYYNPWDSGREEKAGGPRDEWMHSTCGPGKETTSPNEDRDD